MDETFGPVVVLDTVRDADEAVARANASRFGLAAAVLAGDTSRGLGVARRLDAGIVHVNDQPVNDEPQMPFGGVKDSGWGRFGIGFATEDFTELQWVTSRTEPRAFPLTRGYRPLGPSPGIPLLKSSAFLDRELGKDVDLDEAKLALVETVGTFAGHDDVGLLAQGVEREGELEALACLGVPLALGDLLARPGPAWPHLDADVAPLLAAANGHVDPRRHP